MQMQWNYARQLTNLTRRIENEMQSQSAVFRFHIHIVSI